MLKSLIYELFFDSNVDSVQLCFVFPCVAGVKRILVRKVCRIRDRQSLRRDRPGQSLGARTGLAETDFCCDLRLYTRIKK